MPREDEARGGDFVAVGEELGEAVEGVVLESFGGED